MHLTLSRVLVAAFVVSFLAFSSSLAAGDAEPMTLGCENTRPSSDPDQRGIPVSSINCTGSTTWAETFWLLANSKMLETIASIFLIPVRM